MKKLLLIGVILAGAVPVSRAGVNFSIGIGIPAPVPHVVIGHAPAYCPPPVVVAPCPPPVVVTPRRAWGPVVVAPPVYCPPPRHHHSYHYSEHWRGNGRHERYTYRERWH